jgi:uncharacterized membrane protein (UPF0182 family)
VATQAESEQLISREITLQDNDESGTDVLFGDMQLLPVADGLVYVRPFYVAIDGITEYRFVIVSYDDQATFAADLETAFADLFPGFDADITDRVVADGEEPADDPTPTPTDPGIDDTPSLEVPETPDERADTAELLLQADALFAEADRLLRDGDLGGYQETIRLAETYIQAAIASLQN